MYWLCPSPTTHYHYSRLILSKPDVSCCLVSNMSKTHGPLVHLLFSQGLFVYDIWWVFGTEVVRVLPFDNDLIETNTACQMVKVATNLDVPIKILWPKSMVFSSTHGFTMLGLGDIVIPGVFISLALRYDHHRHNLAHQGSPLASARYPKPYFTAALTAYVAGLVTTMSVMHFFKAAQPALLYLRSVVTGHTTLAMIFNEELSVPHAFSPFLSPRLCVVS
jgi:hypothetical protein